LDWVYLIIAGLLEIVWAIGLKYTFGFTKFWPTVATVLVMVASFVLLSIALKTIPVGTGYVVWTGIGAVGTVLVGMFFLDEPRELGRIVCLLLIIVGIVGLKLLSPD
jgi:quaternary ammonium compound-resistance protein SugE